MVCACHKVTLGSRPFQ